MALEFGIVLRRLDEVAANAAEAEALGYEFVATGEHVFFHGPIGNGLISLAAAAGATRRIGLMSTITLVPLYPPALLAKQVAALDVLSAGRFRLGVGVGGEFAKEFEACGVPVAERGARTDEALEVLQRLFTEDDVAFAGRYTSLPGVTLNPKPVQKPQPPVWISGRSKAAMRRCARFGDGWLPYMYTPEMLADSLRGVDEFIEHERSPVRPGVFLFFAVHEDRAQAREMAAERLSRQYNQDFSRLVDRYAVAGNPEDCIARLRQYIEAGARTLVLSSACPAAYAATNEQLLAAAVLPALRGSSA